jgi:hypothetical protein
MTDFSTLVKRDHHDLVAGLDELLAATTVVEIRSALDGVRLGLFAHAEAEDIVLHRIVAEAGAPLAALVGQLRADHLAQQRVLAALVCDRPGSPTWCDHARKLRALVREHALYEERRLVPALRDYVPRAYGELAGRFATERLRQLAMLQPSGPICVPELAQAS